MKINTTYDTTQYTMPTRVANNKVVGSEMTMAKERTSASDLVEFGFKDNLKSYSSTGYSKIPSQNVSAQKIAELKVQYQGDNCPVNDSDIASALIGNLCGLL